MPTQINGIGTTYLGKQKHETYQGVCEECGDSGPLENYQTRVWFTFIFIPVLPLGRKQILNDCPRCRRHQVISIGNWEQLEKEAIESSSEELAANRDDPEAATKLHATFVGFHNNDEAAELAKAMLSKFSENTDINIYLGSWYEQIGQNQDADHCFQKAFELDPEDPRSIRAMSVCMMEQDRLDESRKLLAALEPPSEHYDAGLFYRLGVAFQSRGDHDQAVEQFKLILRHSPEMGRDKDFRKSVRISEQALGEETSLVVDDPFHKSRTFVGTAAAVVVLLGFIGWNVIIAQHRTVYVVNGLPTPITVQIDDLPTIRLPAAGYYPLVIAEGSHRAQVVMPEELASAIEFVIGTPWLGRFTKTPAFVVDPTQASVVIWEQTVYRENPVDGANTFELHVGQAVTTLDDVDYFFEEFPAELQIGNAKSVEKTRVGLLEIRPSELLTYDPNAAEGERLLHFLEQHLRVNHDDNSLLLIYYSSVIANNETDRYLRFLEAGLELRPITVNWHRFYQYMAQKMSRQAELVQRYDRLLESNPNDSNLLYLRGRLEAYGEDSRGYFNKAIAANSENGYAWYGMAYCKASSGRFAEALVACDKAVEIQPDMQGLESMRCSLLFALGRYRDLERELEEALQDETLNLTAHRWLSKVLASQDRWSAIEQLNETLAHRVEEIWSGDPHDLISREQAELLYWKKDYEGLLKVANQMADDAERDRLTVIVNLELGLTRQAAQLVETMKVEDRGYLDLCVSLSWNQQGDTEQAKRWRTIAIEHLEMGDATDVAVAELLRADPDNPSVKANAQDISVDAAHKVLLLVALAQGAGDEGNAILEFAEKLNRDISFPHNFAERAIKNARLQSHIQP